MGKKSGSGSEIRNRDEQPGSYFLEFRNHFFGLKYLYSLMRIRDPVGKNSDPGWKKFGSEVRYKHPGSATLICRLDSVLVDVETALASSVDTQSKADALGRVIKVMQEDVPVPHLRGSY
jgi:hypothetical protein